MATIQSIDELKDYCLRRLGDPVINIEVDLAQSYDRIEDAIAFFVERHFNGTEEVYFKHTMKRADVDAGFITMPEEYVALTEVLSGNNPTSGEAMGDFQFRFMRDVNDRMVGGANNGGISDYYLQMSHLEMMNDLLTSTRAFTYNSVTNHLYPKWKLTDVGSRNLLANGNDITAADWTSTNASLTQDDALDPNSTMLAGTVTSDAAGTFSISQTIDTKQYVRGTYTCAIGVKQGTMAGNLTLTITDSQGVVIHTEAITPDTLWNKQFISFTYTEAHADDIIVTLEGNAAAAGETFFVHNPWLYANAIVVFHGYKILDAAQSLNIYDERWVKDYATALIKQQWGSNLKKFEGVQMPGGITLNGQTVYDESVTEIERLMESFSLDYEEMPTGFWA